MVVLICENFPEQLLMKSFNTFFVGLFFISFFWKKQFLFLSFGPDVQQDVFKLSKNKSKFSIIFSFGILNASNA